jgi:hypothetical protein
MQTVLTMAEELDEQWVRYTVLVPLSLHEQIEQFRADTRRVTRTRRADAVRQLLDYGVRNHPRPDRRESGPRKRPPKSP